jgi:DnaK suppressor protein
VRKVAEVGTAGSIIRCEVGQMDQGVARERLTTERAEVARLLRDAVSAGEQDRETEVDEETGNYADSAQPLTAQGIDDAIAEGFRARIAAIDRALNRLDEGTYGKSILSGDPIPEERLDADPAAELTVQEARARSQS